MGGASKYDKREIVFDNVLTKIMENAAAFFFFLKQQYPGNK